MQLLGGPPLRHFLQCWRWASHSGCAAALVEQFAEAADDMLAALKAEYGTEDTIHYPGLLMEAADQLKKALVDAGYRFPKE